MHWKGYRATDRSYTENINYRTPFGETTYCVLPGFHIDLQYIFLFEYFFLINEFSFSILLSKSFGKLFYEFLMCKFSAYFFWFETFKFFYTEKI